MQQKILNLPCNFTLAVVQHIKVINIINIKVLTELNMSFPRFYKGGNFSFCRETVIVTCACGNVIVMQCRECLFPKSSSVKLFPRFGPPFWKHIFAEMRYFMFCSLSGSKQKHKNVNKPRTCAVGTVIHL